MILRVIRIEVDGVPRFAEAVEGGFMLFNRAPWLGGQPSGKRVAGGRLLAPVTPSKIIGIGANYRDHALEMGKPLPLLPKVFLKPPTAVIGPDEAIRIPPGTVRVDHEAELGVVIGARCHRVSAQDALGFVFGYTAVNDVTARDFQKEDGLFARAKGFDSFCPVGPSVVAGLDPAALSVRCEVNGQIRQDGNTSDMVFPVSELVAFVSNIMTLEPGDLITTGTPAGVGALRAGDEVIVRVQGVGALKNTVQDRDDR